MAQNDASGWRREKANNRVSIYYKGTRVGHVNSTAFYLNNISVTGSLAPTAAITAGNAIATTTLTSTTTMTAGTGVIVTTGNEVVSTGDHKITAGNARLGVVSTFATTEPTSAVVMKQGTAFVGAITTSSGFMSDGTVLKKIIAAGTASNIET